MSYFLLIDKHGSQNFSKSMTNHSSLFNKNTSNIQRLQHLILHWQLFLSHRYYLRLHSEIGSTQDDDEPRTTSGGRGLQDRGAQEWEQSRNQGRFSQEVMNGATAGHYKRVELPGMQNGNHSGVHIPPVDYLDPPGTYEGSSSPGTSARILSLQEAILDRTLRLKKVPEELKRGIQKY